MKQSSLIIISTLVILSTIFPYVSFAQENEVNSSKDHQLIQLVEDVSAIEGTIITAGTYLYIIESTVDEVIVQFNDKTVSINKESIKYINNSEVIDDTPLYIDYNNQLNFDGHIATEKIQWTNDSSNTIFLEENSEYKTFLYDKENVMLIGNTIFKLVEQKQEENNSSKNENTEYQEENQLETTDKIEDKQEIKEENIENNTIQTVDTLSTTTDSWNNVKNAKYFTVNQDNVPVYDNRTGELIQISSLIKGQTYPIYSDYGNWHRIRLGEYFAYVQKSQTIPVTESNLANENDNKASTGRYITVTSKQTTVYDNTSGKLIAFGEIHKSTKLKVISDYGNWWRINFSNRIGYINKNDVSSSFLKGDKFFKVTSDDAKIFDNRSGKLIQVGTLTKGQTYKIQRDYGNWWEINFGKYKAYIAKNNTEYANNNLKNLNKSFNNSTTNAVITQNLKVYDNSNGKLVEFGEIKKGVSYPIVSDYGNWWRILIADRIGYISKAGTKVDFKKSDRFFKATDDMPIYDNRTGKLIEVGKLIKNQVYQRVSDYGNWHRIQFGDIYGYVYKPDTEVALNASISNLNKNYQNSTLKVKATDNISVYDNSAGTLVKFGEIKKGQTYTLVSDYGNWYRILFANRVGYISKDTVDGIFNSNTTYFEAKENVAVYDNRSGSLIQVGTLIENQTFKIERDYGDWHQINFGSYSGYVYQGSTLPSFNNQFKNRAKSNNSIGTLTTKVTTTVYDNTGKKLVPFATIQKGKVHSVTKDYGNWIEVNIGGRYGYVSKNDVSLDIMKSANIVNSKKTYTYEDMQEDISNLKKQYPGLISSEVIGKSIDGRNLYAIKLGKGSTEIFINGSHHAREWLTTNLLMEMVDTYSQAYVNDTAVDGFNAKDILDKTSIWFVPMVNPDGVTLVQKGAFSAKNPAEVIRLNGGSTNFNRWKANIRGVDLNRQYPAGWSTIQNARPYPSYMNYKGKFALSEPETMAIYQFTKKHDFKTAVAYHSSGEILYWNYKLKSGTSLMNTSKSLANKIKNKTGYSLYMPGSNPSGGGYTDWFIESEKKPGFTPEISPHVGERPVPLSYFDRIWKQNNSIGLMLAEEAYLNRNKR